VCKQNLTLSNGVFDALNIVKNRLKLRKLQPLPIERVRNTKKQTTEHYKAGSQSPKKFFVCCSVTIRVQK
jgi:hypothetical protein